MLRRQFMVTAPSQLMSLNDAPSRMRFFGPVIDRIAADSAFRKEFVDHARDRLGLDKFNEMLYQLVQDAKPQVRSQPMVLRMMQRVIWGYRRRGRRR